MISRLVDPKLGEAILGERAYYATSFLCLANEGGEVGTAGCAWRPKHASSSGLEVQFIGIVRVRVRVIRLNERG